MRLTVLPFRLVRSWTTRRLNGCSNLTVLRGRPCSVASRRQHHLPPTPSLVPAVLWWTRLMVAVPCTVLGLVGTLTLVWACPSGSGVLGVLVVDVVVQTSSVQPVNALWQTPVRTQATATTSTTSVSLSGLNLTNCKSSGIFGRASALPYFCLPHRGIFYDVSYEVRNS